MRIRFYFLFLTFCITGSASYAQNKASIARIWNDATLQCIRWDFARPTVHARNLYHTSVAMYDAWALHDSFSRTCFLGNKIGNFQFTKPQFKSAKQRDSSINEAISFAVYRILKFRFINSPNKVKTIVFLDSLFLKLGYDYSNLSTNYTNGSPAALGNFIAQSIINFGMTDGANEINSYINQFYQPVNQPLYPVIPGNKNMTDPNRWQPLGFNLFIDQSGNVIPGAAPAALSPEWGNVLPFSLTNDDKKLVYRDGNIYTVYLDPGAPIYLDTISETSESNLFKWTFELVPKFGSELTPDDTTYWDISPKGIGKIDSLPKSVMDYPVFYSSKNNYLGKGYSINPRTNQPYQTQIVKRGDFTRVLAEFWADGVESETPPGHWFYILNKVNYDTLLNKKVAGMYPVSSQIEWDVKSYLLMGGAMHDCAVSTWSIKGLYDFVRPISVVRYLADNGQCSDSTLPNYSIKGINLAKGLIELVLPFDTLAKDSTDWYKIKLFTWKGHDHIQDIKTQTAGVGWILAENWWPYQRPTFVTPPFPGYISGHSTFSHAGAQVLTMLTGDPYFPGGIGEFKVQKDDFLKFEKGPSEAFTLQWAKYKDAADQSAISRIYGGIHPPIDDIPGRKNGQVIGAKAFNKGMSFILPDDDNDGYPKGFDCNDSNATIHPDAIELCDGIDNNCNGLIDEGLVKEKTYYKDLDGDGFGNNNDTILSCYDNPPKGYAVNGLDCNDSNKSIHPNAPEKCDLIDNNCNNQIDEGLVTYIYYRDFDTDYFGSNIDSLQSCFDKPMQGFVLRNGDCDDSINAIHPGAYEINDNGIDEDCSGSDAITFWHIVPVPFNKEIKILSPYNGLVTILLYNLNGVKVEENSTVLNGVFTVEFNSLKNGIYLLRIVDEQNQTLHIQKIVKMN